MEKTNRHRINLKKEEAIERLEKLRYELGLMLCENTGDDSLKDPLACTLIEATAHTANLIELLKSSAVENVAFFFLTSKPVKRGRKSTAYLTLPAPHLTWKIFKNEKFTNL